MKGGPHVYRAEALRNERDWPQTCCGDGRYVMARPLAYPTLRQRLIITWRVFTGQWDALKWDGGQ